MSEPKVPPPWLFALTGMPYGVVGSFTGVVMPYLARRAGIEVSDIGWFVSLLFVPTFFQFFYAPVIDFGPRRKHWLVITATIGSGSLLGAYLTPLPGGLTQFLAFAFMAQLISGLVGPCNGGLMATLIPDDKRGKAGAWYNVGNLCGGGISAAVAVYMLGHGFDPMTVGLINVAMMVLPSLAVLVVEEPLREHVGTLGETLRGMAKDAKNVLGTRAGATGILLCLSPVGTAALANYFGAIAEDYAHPGVLAHVRELAHLQPLVDLFQLPLEKTLLDERTSELLAFIGGPVGQVLTAVGALIGGFLCDRYNRRSNYLLSGSLTAVCGIVMALSPASDSTFIWGALTYALITGYCYSAFTATVLETIGKSTKSASLQYSMFVAAGNVAITYTGFIDSRFHESHGVAGVVGSDAALNLGGVVILAIVFWKLGSFGKARLKATAPASE